MNGKSKCRILKQIRREIAKQNDIEFVTSECKFQGECSGTCPKCESEVQYLEQELSKRKAAGKAVAVAGIAAALLVGSAGCTLDPINVEQTVPQEIIDNHNAETEPSEPNYETEWDGVPPLDETEGLELIGEVPYSGEELDGDVAYVGDEWTD